MRLRLTTLRQTSSRSRVAASNQLFAATSKSSPAPAPCSCRPLAHETLLWQHCLGHPSLPLLRARVRGQGHERYFLLVVDDYSRYNTVFPLRSKDRGGEFSSDLLRAFCRAEGIRQTFTLPASPQKNGIAERRIGMVMDVARTSMIHAAAPHFLWLFAVQYTAHQINLQPRVFLSETTPTLRWTGKVGDASAFRVWGSRFYHPTSRRVLSSQAVTFDESVSYYRVSQVDPAESVEVAVDSGAARGAEPAGAGPGGDEPGVAESEGAEPGGAEPEPVEPGGAEPGGAESGGAEPGGAEPERAEFGDPLGVSSRREPLSAQRLREWYARRCSRAAGATGPAAGGASEVGAAGGAAGAAGPGGAGAGGTGAVRGLVGVGAARGAGVAGPRGARTGGTGAAGAGGAAGVGAVGAGVVATGGAAGAGAAGGTGDGGVAGVVAGDPGAEGTGAVSAVSGGATRPRPYYVPLLQQVLGLPPSTSPTPPLQSPPPVQSQSQLQPASPLPGPSPYSRPTRGLTERRDPESRPASPESRPASPESRPESPVHAVCTGRGVARQRPPPVPGTHYMTLHPSNAPQRFPCRLLLRPLFLTVRTRSLTPFVLLVLLSRVFWPLLSLTLRLSPPSASALVAELVDFAAACRLDYAASLVTESESASDEFECFAASLPHLVSMLLAPEGDPDAPDIPTPCSYAEAIEGPYSSQWQTAMDTEMASWKDHFLALDPTVLTIDLLEQHLLAAETSVVAVGAARGTPRTPFFEGCSPSPLTPSYASAAAVDVLGAEDVGAASASGKRRSSKGKGGKGGGGGSGGCGGGSSGGCGGSGVGGGGGSGGGSGGFGSSGGGSNGGGGSGGSGSGGGRSGDTQQGGCGGGQRQQHQRRSETPSPQQLREWFSQRGASRGSGSYPNVIHTGDCAGQTCGKPHTQPRCFSRLDDAWRAEFGDEAERPRWAELLRSGVAIFDLDYDAILAAMYALSVSAEGDCYLCVPPDPGIEAAALGASECALPGTAPAEALHTFTLDSGASRCFFRDRTTLIPLSAPVPVRLADPSGGPVLARSSTVLPCPAVPSSSLSGLHLPMFSTNLVSSATLKDAMVTTTTPGGQRASICTCTRTGRHLATFTRRPRSSLYTLATKPPQVSAPPPALACLPCIEGRQRAAPHSSSFPPTTAPLQNLHMDVWGPVRVSGQGRECYFLLVVDDYTRYTTVFPLSSKGEVLDVLITWIRAVRLQLCVCTLTEVVSSPPTSLPTLHWTGEVGDVSGEGSRAFVRDTSADKLSARAIPCIFLGFPPDVPSWQFYHPTSRSVFPSLDVTCVSVDPLPNTVPAEVAVHSGAARGVASGGAGSGGAEPEGAEHGGAEPAGSEGAESGGAEPRGTALSRGLVGASPRLSPRPEPHSPQQLRKWFAERTRLRSGAAGAGDSAAEDTGAGGVGATRLGVAGVFVAAGCTGGAAAAGPGGARTRGAGATGPGASGTGAGGAGAGDTGAVDPRAGGGGAGSDVSGGTSAGATVWPRPYFVPLLQQVLGLSSSTGLTPPLQCPPPDQSQPPLQPASPPPAPSPYTEQTRGLTEREEPVPPLASHVRAVRTGRDAPHPRSLVLGTHTMALRPSSIPLRVPLPPPLESSLPAIPDLKSDIARAASPTVTRLLASVVTNLS
ncbi:unnamed protein product [Closterium sp. NIES-53]